MAELNTEFFDNLNASIEAIPTCDALSDLISGILEMFTDYLASISDKITEALGLLDIPTDLSEVIEWITSFIGIEQAKYIELVAMQALYVAEFARLVATITDKISSLSCSISPPILPAI